jgi:hypothetical protein
MSEQELCDKCNEFYRDRGHGVGIKVRPDQHCHHFKSYHDNPDPKEEEVKPLGWKKVKRCEWCDYWKTFNKIYRREKDGNSAMSYLVRQAFDLITRGEYLQECPMCHKKLEV